MLDGVSMPGTFYIVYLGFEDASLMTSIQRAYHRAHPPLTKQLVARTKKARLRVGFAGAYWKRHSVCKLLCGIVRGLASLDDFEVVLFDATEESDDWLTWTLGTGASHKPLDMTLSSRQQVQDVDILVYAELGMRARALTWAHARLAPVQVLFWGHPHTSGLPVSDSEQNINLNLIWWRRWRRRGLVSVYAAVSRRSPCHTGDGALRARERGGRFDGHRGSERRRRVCVFCVE